MYNNPYINPYNPNYGQQSLNDRIDNQIAQLNQMKEQLKNNQHNGGITQNFQLTPTQNGIKYANTIDEVAKETIFVETPFFSKDMSVMWLKNINGGIKSYELNEIVPKDSRDLQIEYLQAQIEELKKGMKANESNVNVNEPITNADESEEPSNVSTVSKSSKKSKQSE